MWHIAAEFLALAALFVTLYALAVLGMGAGLS